MFLEKIKLNQLKRSYYMMFFQVCSLERNFGGVRRLFHAANRAKEDPPLCKASFLAQTRWVPEMALSTRSFVVVEKMFYGSAGGLRHRDRISQQVSVVMGLVEDVEKAVAFRLTLLPACAHTFRISYATSKHWHVLERSPLLSIITERSFDTIRRPTGSEGACMIALRSCFAHRSPPLSQTQGRARQTQGPDIAPVGRE